MRDPFASPWLIATPALSAAAPIAVSLDDQIRNAASLVSIALALLTLFTNRRLTKLDDERDTLGSWDRPAAGQVLLDAVLLCLTVLVLVTISPLIVEAWPPRLARQNAVVPNLLLIAAVGLVGVAAVQLRVLGTRVRVYSRNTSREC